MLAAALALAGCSTPVNRAPVEDRGTFAGQVTPGAQSGSLAPDPQTLPGAENAGKPGYYTVRPGDTLIRIGLETGQSWRDLARWNNLENANLIEVGQVLRVVPPVAGTVAAVSADTGVVTRPIAPPGVAPTPGGPDAPKPAPAPAPAPGAGPVSPPPAPTATVDDIAFIWPSSGAVLAGFDEARNKGVDIGGNAGDPVLAAADGRVVYAGAGLRGYGNLIILKHNNTYLTAYAHNRTLLVKEDQNVRRGQKIAEMGNTDADRVKLHFEIRRQGKPVDPARYLPAR
ncbi:murein DD-endopeptidase MepM/ murein hydrolase activator NlpD [Melaminivora alkalimesophila]|uniref:Murein DD-endopeptidase MepM/ murein hydrolase activator NlpD n=1 Tax=Melaminivora alkalimesophila TaxID=1165852 RepID=A0A317R9T2_9BURK|nr:murein DD-endopeptidase MepM/ murein hydrolase activator NlpD [Melaminivora alkalimesophila]